MWQAIPWARFALHSRPKPRVQGKPRPARRLFLEELEDRIQPTVIFPPQFGGETLLQSSAGDYNYVPLSSPNVHVIFWGSYWATHSDQITSLTRDMTTILNSNYTGGLTDYHSDGKVVYAGPPYQDPSALPAGFEPGNSGNSGSAIQGEIDSFINTNPTVLSPPSNGDAIYTVVTEEDTGGGSYNAPGIYTTSSGSTLPLMMISLAFVPSDQDGFDRTFSHELIEAMSSNPNNHDGLGVQVTPGSNLPPDVLGTASIPGQIADYEPGTFPAYAYRIGGSSGVRVTPYWSNATDSSGAYLPGQGNYIVPDGNTQELTLKPIWTVDSSGHHVHNGQYDLYINGDQLANHPDDSLTINDTRFFAESCG
jgi:hypothetical protein